MDHFSRPGIPFTTDELIIDRICQKFKVSKEQLKTKSRKHPIIFYRQLSIALIRKYTNQKVCEIGELFNKDHASVTHSVGVINNYIQYDKQKAKLINEIEIELNLTND